MYLQINMVKYDADREITNIYGNLQTVWSQFFTDKLLFIYIRSTSNIYWFIGIRMRWQWIPTKSYSVTFDHSLYSVSYSMSDTKGNFKLFAPTYFLPLAQPAFFIHVCFIPLFNYHWHQTNILLINTFLVS